MRKVRKKRVVKKTKKTNNFNPNFKIFDREEFYKNELINNTNQKFTKGTIIKTTDFAKFERVNGVYAKWGKDEKGKDICLDVSQSANIGREIEWTHKAILKGKKSQDLSNEEIKNARHRNPGKYIKYRNIASYSDITYRLVKKNIKSKEDREQLEMEYAHKYKSKFWYPCPGKQQKKSGYMIPFIEYQQKYK